MTDRTTDGRVRVCRDCGEEYRLDVEVCADCGGVLEEPAADGGALVPPPSGPPPESEIPEAERAGTHALYQSGRVRDVVPLAERLRATGIPCWLVEQPATQDAPPRYALLVHQGDASRGLAAVADLIASEHGADYHAVEAHFDHERGYLQCPACGATPPSGARECPECGLGLGGEEAAQEPGE